MTDTRSDSPADIETLVRGSLDERAAVLGDVDGDMPDLLDRVRARHRRRRATTVAASVVLVVAASGAIALALDSRDTSGRDAAATDARTGQGMAPVASLPGQPAPTTVPHIIDGFAASEQAYVVVAGDSIFAIASRFAVDPEHLAEFNGWPEGLNHVIVPGDWVMIPPGAPLGGRGDIGLIEP